MNRRWLVFVLLAICSSGTHVLAADWAMDRTTSTLSFVARYEGAPAPGRFRNFDIQLRFDPRRPEQGHLQVSVDVASVDMESADINAAIRGAEWLNVERHRRAEFDSRQISRDQAGSYLAQGTLRLKGIERKLVVPFVWRSSGPSATMTGHFHLDRTAFHIGTGEWSDGTTIGLEVEVRFEVRLHPTNQGARDD
jgi:polyisoprenoid-binding protein YceI